METTSLTWAVAIVGLLLIGLLGGLQLVAAVPIFIWDRDLGFRQNTVFYWVVVWGMFPAFGVIEGVYCFARLLE